MSRAPQTTTASARSRTVRLPAALHLEGGGELPQAEARATFYGNLDGRLHLICHAFSSSSTVHEWWPQILETIDLSRDGVVALNALGSCHGSTGPESIEPRTGRPYHAAFPMVTSGDQAQFLLLALEAMGIREVETVIGCSFGGQLALKLLETRPDFAKRYVIGAASELPQLSKLINNLGIKIIKDGDYGVAALEQARMLLRFHCASIDGIEMLNAKLLELSSCAGNYFEAESRLFAGHFSPHSYVRLMHAMNQFSFAPSRLAGKLRSDQEIRLLALKDDYFSPAAGIELMARELSTCGAVVSCDLIDTSFGHESWLIDADLYCQRVKPYV